MRPSKDLVGKPVISIDDGRFVGNVKDIYVDPELNWLVGIHLGTEGLLRRKALLIPREAVVVFGVDAVLVKNADVVQDNRELDAADKWLRLDDLQGRHVDTPGGTKVGDVGDVLLDQDARVVGLKLNKVHVEGPIAADRTILRAAVLDTGSEDGVLTIDLARAERTAGVSGDAAEA